MTSACCRWDRFDCAPATRRCTPNGNGGCTESGFLDCLHSNGHVRAVMFMLEEVECTHKARVQVIEQQHNRCKIVEAALLLNSLMPRLAMQILQMIIAYHLHRGLGKLGIHLHHLGPASGLTPTWEPSVSCPPPESIPHCSDSITQHI